MSFRRSLALITVAGLALRLVYAVGFRRHAPVGGDAYFYHHSANLLAAGHGFINPFVWLTRGIRVQAADHPPLYVAYLTFFSLVGLRGTVSHLVASCLLGAASVPVLGLVGRRVGGPAVGLTTAAVAVVYPNIWASDGMLLSETAAILCTALVLLAAYGYADHPSCRRAGMLGGALALAALSRAELMLLAILVVAPLTMLRGSRSWRDRVRELVLAVAACIVLLAPWVGYNLHRFERPVYLSTGLEVTMSISNCDSVYYGPFIGFWDIRCAVDRAAAAGMGVTTDESLLSDVYWRDSIAYMRAHVRHVPKVLLARWGRMSGLYRPIQQTNLDVLPGGRDRFVAVAGWLTWYPLAALGAGGIAALRRRHVPVYPLLGPFAVTLLTVTVTFAATRYRAPADGALCVLAAVGLVAGVRGVRSLTSYRPGD
jgi:Dolichyl-phosphate-mannose-protein mannosyltransferase